MNSLSSTDISAVDFLARNFSELFTIRQIALKLKSSPAGLHASLKKLEKEGILKSEKLGSGLFFRINFESKSARYLTSMIISEDKEKIDFGDGIHHVKMCILDGKKALVMATDVTKVKEEIPQKAEIKFTILSQEDIFERVSLRDKEILEFIRRGKCVMGEEVLFALFKRGAFRI